MRGGRERGRHNKREEGVVNSKFSNEMMGEKREKRKSQHFSSNKTSEETKPYKIIAKSPTYVNMVGMRD